MGINCGEAPVDLNKFTAKDAKERSGGIFSEISKIQLDEILISILKETDSGKFSVYYYKSLLLNVKKELERRGFLVQDNSTQMDGACYFITWK